jgi:hypothetical protein
MYKPLVALAILSAMSVPAVAQTAPATNQAQPAKPQTVKKRVCEVVDEDSYSRLGNRKICKTIEVPVQPAAQPSASSAQPATQQNGVNN